MKTIQQLGLMAAAFLLALPLASSAQTEGNCGEYSRMAGEMAVRQTPKGLTFVATGSAKPHAGDGASYRDARSEAELKAKAILGQFLREDASLRSEGGVEARSAALLRGVKLLGTCHTRGEEVRVSVELTPESVAQADTLAGMIKRSLTQHPTPQPPREMP